MLALLFMMSMLARFLLGEVGLLLVDWLPLVSRPDGSRVLLPRVPAALKEATESSEAALFRFLEFLDAMSTSAALLPPGPLLLLLR